MRISLLIGLLLFLNSCSSTSPFINYSGDFSMQATPIEITSKTEFFSDETISQVIKSNFVKERGDYYLNKIIDGYHTQTQGFNFSEDNNIGVSFRVKEIRVKSGFTLNFVDPGPIYRMFMDVDIYRYGELVVSETYRTSANMALVVKKDRFFNWLSTEDRNNPDNQIATFERGLRDLYRDLYFKHLDISLSL